jgi:E3 ubiquitin-protein ligase RNF38/44
MIAVLIVNVPQIVAAFIILSLNWNDNRYCDEAHNLKWKLWATLSATRMAIYSGIIVIMYKWKEYFDSNPRPSVQITSLRNIVDAMGLVWFIIGNLWLFGDDNGAACVHPQHSPIYRLCVSMVVINYLQICLPCILAALLLPLFCFCMPCLIRILARYNRTNQVLISYIFISILV